MALEFLGMGSIFGRVQTLSPNDGIPRIYDLSLMKVKGQLNYPVVLFCNFVKLKTTLVLLRLEKDFFSLLVVSLWKYFFLSLR
jgi:hypothetical protein